MGTSVGNVTIPKITGEIPILNYCRRLCSSAFVYQAKRVLYLIYRYKVLLKYHQLNHFLAESVPEIVTSKGPQSRFDVETVPFRDEPETDPLILILPEQVIPLSVIDPDIE